MSNREQPWKVNEGYFPSILAMQGLIIPMNQRGYEWCEEEVKQSIDDLLEILDEGKYKFNLGTFLTAEIDGKNYINDGQQRLLTKFLELCIISIITKKRNTRKQILDTIAIDRAFFDEDDALLREQASYIKQEGNKWVFNDSKYDIPENFKNKEIKNLPKILCYNKCDNIALIAILNNFIKYWCEYDFQEIENEDGNIVYKIKDRKKKESFKRFKTKKGLLDYLNKDGYIILDKMNNSHSSNLYCAAETIHTVFIKKENKYLTDIWKFIKNDVCIQLTICKKEEYASKMFEWTNNRGKPVGKLDILKSNIISKLDPNDRSDFYNKWESLKDIKSPNDAFKKNGKNGEPFTKKLFSTAIRIQFKQIERKVTEDTLYKRLLSSEDLKKDIYDYMNNIKKIIKIMNDINEYKWGRFILYSSNQKISWEGFQCLLIPIIYHTGKLDKQLIDLCIQWYIKSLLIGPEKHTFNSMEYFGKFCKLSHDVMNSTENFHYLPKVKEILNCKGVLNYKINAEKYNLNIKNDKKCLLLLLFLELNLTNDATDIQIPKNFTIEHIDPQSNDKNHTQYLGNKTLYEGKNSENTKHRGNFSLKDLSYKKKIEHYKQSESKLTKQLANKYQEVFDEEQIIERNKYLANKFNEIFDRWGLNATN